jgi:hypothetical protein
MLDRTTSAALKQTIAIAPLNMGEATIKLVGTAPFVMNRMSSRNRQAMMLKQESGELEFIQRTA